MAVWAGSVYKACHFGSEPTLFSPLNLFLCITVADNGTIHVSYIDCLTW